MGREELLARQRAILQAATAERRGLTADEQREFDSLQREIEAIDARAAQQATGQTAGRSQSPEDGGNGGEGSGAEENAVRQAAENERTRIREITNMCTRFGMDAQQYIDNGSTVEAVRAAVIDHMCQEGSPIAGRVSVTASAEDKFRAAARDALLMRGGVSLDDPADGSRTMMGMRLRDLAIECLQADDSTSTGLNRRSDEEIFAMLKRGFYNPEAAFPAILDQTIEKAYREGYKRVNVTFDRWTKKGTLTDFKIHDNYYVAGPVGEFLEVPENGELKHDVFGDAKLPQRQLKTYGRQFTLSRKAFIDDDIGLVTSIPARYAASAKKTINRQVYSILLNNQTIYDGVALFHKSHKNLLKNGTAITQDAMQTMMMALANQKDQFDREIIINPAKIIVPSGLQFEMYTLFNSPVIETSGNTQAVNPLYQYRSQLEVIEEPTINALSGGLGNVMPWFLLGDPADVDFIEVDYLNGQEIPTIRRAEVPGQLGFIWDIFLDWGISVMDYRGVVKNPGVAVTTKLEMA